MFTESQPKHDLHFFQLTCYAASRRYNISCRKVEMEPTRDERVPDASEEGLPLIELETLLTRRPSWRKRLMQMTLALAVVVFAVATLHGVILPSSAPSSAPGPAKVPITLLSNVNFGTLTLNGTRLNAPPPLTISMPVKGTTTITLTAPPFRPYTCRFTNLTAPTDDSIHCRLGIEEKTTPINDGTPPGGFTVGIFLTPDDLPANQQSQALEAMSLPLSAPQQTTVHPGEYIATSYLRPRGITSQRAATSLLASASFEPSQLPGPPFGPYCGVGICPWSGFLAEATTIHQRAWSLFFTESLHWQMSDAAGRVRATVNIPSSDIVGVLLTDNAGAGWQIAQINTILGTLRDTTCQAGISTLWFTMNGGDVTVLHDQGVEGCELRGQINGVDQGRYVWRFGVLLAADASAHFNQPTLPVAPESEIAAVGG